MHMRPTGISAFANCAVFVLALRASALPALPMATPEPGASTQFGNATTQAMMDTHLPEFTHRDAQAWINSKPLAVADLRGHVVLVHVWAFECWNCYRSFPWLESVADRYASQGLEIVGVHSPEFEREKVRDSVVEKAGKYGLHHPIMLDNDLSYWRALDNEYWPAWYLVDRRGVIRKVAVGETHPGDPRARALESQIEALLAEAPTDAG
jgi:thiol-disulfide isomerase/thioredoxin